MTRRFVQLHTIVLSAASIGFLMFPAGVLTSLGNGSSGFGMISLTRVIAMLLLILTAAVSQLQYLSRSAQARAFRGMGGAYAVAGLMLVGQGIAIWNTFGGATIAAAAILFAIVFAVVTSFDTDQRPVEAAHA